MMIEQLAILLFYGLLIAISAVVYTCVIVAPGEILARVWALGTQRLPEWLHKPLISCEKCVAGQWSLWLFPFYTVKKIGIVYDPILHILSILVTIFFAVMVKKLLNVEPPQVYKVPKWTPPELKTQNKNESD